MRALGSLFIFLFFSTIADAAVMEDDACSPQDHFANMLQQEGVIDQDSRLAPSKLINFYRHRIKYFEDNRSSATIQEEAATERNGIRRFKNRHPLHIGCDESVCKYYWSCEYCSYVRLLNTRAGERADGEFD